MGKIVLLVALFTLVAFASSPAPATKVEKQSFSFSGVIEKVDQSAKTITVRGKVGGQEKVMTFVINDKTKITSAGKTIDQKAFYNPKPGTRCLVDYFIPSESGKFAYNPVAVNVDYSSPKLAPTK